MKPTINATTSPTIKIASILALVTILAGCSATTTIPPHPVAAEWEGWVERNSDIIHRRS